MSAAEHRWLAHLGQSGDRVAGEVYGYDRLALDWRVDFDRGLPEHLIYLLVAGAIGGSAGGESVTLHAGSLLWMSPRTPFHLHASGDVEPVLYRFRLATDAPCPVDRLVVPDAWPVRGSVDALVQELGGALDFRGERLRGLLVTLFSSLFRISGGTRSLAPLPPATRRELEAHVDARPDGRPTVGELAAVAGLSEDYFCRRFRETFGLPPRRWLVRRRINQAMLRLDETDSAISTIANDLGYPDVFLFSRQFKLITGVSPRSWRNRLQNRD